MQWELIRPRPTEHVLICGLTGCGKTTLAERLLAEHPYVAVIDTKGLIKWPGYKRYSRLSQLVRAKEDRLIYAPDPVLELNESYYDQFFEWVYRRERTTVYIDELYTISRNGFALPYLRVCLTRGREKGISVYSSTQRPMRIPQEAFTESSKFFVFRLNLEGDRKRLTEAIEVDETEIAALKKQFFLYASIEGEKYGPLRLNLSS